MESYDSQVYIAFRVCFSSILVPAVYFHFHFFFGLLALLKLNKVFLTFFEIFERIFKGNETGAEKPLVFPLKRQTPLYAIIDLVRSH